MDDEQYERFKRDVKQYTDGIDTERSVSSERGGKPWWRDMIVSFREFVSMGMNWAKIPRTLIFLLALVPLALSNLNVILRILFGITFSEVWANAIAFIGFGIIFVLGYWSYRSGGVFKRSKEIKEVQDPVYFLQWRKLSNLEETQKEILDRLGELEDELR